MTDIESEVRKLTPEDGDVIVLRTESWLPEEGRAVIAAVIGGVIERSGKKVQALILEGGMTVDVLRLSQLQDREVSV